MTAEAVETRASVRVGVSSRPDWWVTPPASRDPEKLRSWYENLHTSFSQAQSKGGVEPFMGGTVLDQG